MAVTVEITTHVKATVGGVVKEYGSTTVPVEYSITNGHVFETRATVADDYDTAILWTTGDGDMDKFELLYIKSDADVYIEMRSDMATDEYLLFEIKANVPTILTSDNIGAQAAAARLDAAILVEDTDFAQVDRIVVQRDVAADAGDALVHMVLFA